MVSVGGPVQEDITNNSPSPDSDSLSKGKRVVSHHSADFEANLNNVPMIGFDEDTPSWFSRNRGLVRSLGLVALAGLIFGWWVSATILHATRHRWIVQTFFAWSFIAIIAFRFIPTSVVTRPIEAVWIPLVQKPFFSLPKYVRYGLGWLALLAIVLGSAFGFKLENVRNFFFRRQMSFLNPLIDPR